MRPAHDSPGGDAVGVLKRMEAWESNLILNLRLWCDGPVGQNLVLNGYHNALAAETAAIEFYAFEDLLRRLMNYALRPMVRHDVNCSCVGADENVFVMLVRHASNGELNDAALIATLLVGPAQAEHIAVLAGQVGACMRRIHAAPREYSTKLPRNIARLDNTPQKGNRYQ